MWPQFFLVFPRSPPAAAPTATRAVRAVGRSCVLGLTPALARPPVLPSCRGDAETTAGCVLWIAPATPGTTAAKGASEGAPAGLVVPAGAGADGLLARCSADDDATTPHPGRTASLCGAVTLGETENVVSSDVPACAVVLDAQRAPKIAKMSPGLSWPMTPHKP